MLASITLKYNGNYPAEIKVTLGSRFAHGTVAKVELKAGEPTLLLCLRLVVVRLPHNQPRRLYLMHPRPCLAALLIGTILIGPQLCLARGEWPDGPNKGWFQSLERPDNDANPHRKLDPKSLFCCGEADVVKTKFRVESGGDKYPEDRWYAWLDNQWTLVPPEKVVKGFAPDGRPYLFMLANTIQCFVRPKGGI